MIQTHHLTKSFHTDEIETNAVKDLTLEIEQGEFVAIMGPSGCGKTTLLNLLGLMEKPSSGNYAFEGIQTEGFSEKRMTRLRRGNMGFIFQNYNLVEELTITENVELPLFFAGMPRKARRKHAEDILHRLKLSHRAKHYPRQLSGGQQQRVAFARAIIHRPKLLLADEPTGNLDSKNGTLLLDLLNEHNRSGGTIVMVTHSIKDASCAHRVIQLRDGKMMN